MRQLLTESLMLSAAGAMLGVGAGCDGGARPRGVRAGVAAAASTPSRSMQRVLAFTAIVAVATGVLFGLVPAWRGGVGVRRRRSPSTRAAASADRAGVRAALVVADLVLALVLLAGAGLMLRTMASLTRTSPGFTSERILSLQFSLVGEAYAKDPAVVAFQTRALERLRALPGVESAALADEVPFGGNYDCRGFHAQGRMKANTVDDPCIERYGVTPDYARLMGIPLRRRPVHFGRGHVHLAAGARRFRVDREARLGQRRSDRIAGAPRRADGPSVVHGRRRRRRRAPRGRHRSQ